MAKRALLLVAHGSRREASNEEVRALTRSLARRLGGEYGVVDCAFLELASPSIPEGIDRLVAGGVASITVLPYFLVSGRHVVADIPGIVDQKQRDHPAVSMEISGYLGEADEVVELLESIARGRER